MWTYKRMALAKKQKKRENDNIKNSDTINNSNNSNNNTQYKRASCYPTHKISMVSVKCIHKCEENKNAPFYIHYNLVAGICPFCTHFPFTSIRSLQKLLFTAIFFPPLTTHLPPVQPAHILKYVFFFSWVRCLLSRSKFSCLGSVYVCVYGYVYTFVCIKFTNCIGLL